MSALIGSGILGPGSSPGALIPGAPPSFTLVSSVDTATGSDLEHLKVQAQEVGVGSETSARNAANITNTDSASGSEVASLKGLLTSLDVAVGSDLSAINRVLVSSLDSAVGSETLQVLVLFIKALSLWQSGSSSNSAPPNTWQSLVFNDSAWPQAIGALGSPVIQGSPILWAEQPPASGQERALFRAPFTLGAIPNAAGLMIYVRGNLNGAYINNKRIMVYRNDWQGQYRTCYVPIDLLRLGLNVLAFDIQAYDAHPQLEFRYVPS